MTPSNSKRSPVHVCIVGEKKLEDDLLRWSTEAFPGAFSMQFWGMNDALPSGRCDAFIASLATTTWSRARHVSPLGPSPMRSDAWPYGFPWLNDGQRQLAEQANVQFHFVTDALKEAVKHFPLAELFFLFPEDLGNAPGGRPASPWQLGPLRRMATELGLLRSAVYQCEFGPSEWASPLGVLCCPPLRGSRVRHGWPLFLGNSNHQYIGPLPRRCSCLAPHSPHRKLGGDDLRKADGSSLSKGFASWLLSRILHRKTHTAGLFQTGSSFPAARRPSTEDAKLPGTSGGDDSISTDTDDHTLDPGVSEYEGPFVELDVDDLGTRHERQQNDKREERETRKTRARIQRTKGVSQSGDVEKIEAATKKSDSIASARECSKELYLKTKQKSSTTRQQRSGRLGL